MNRLGEEPKFGCHIIFIYLFLKVHLNECVAELFLSLSNMNVLLFVTLNSEIKEEATETRAEVKTFDHSKLKHVETQEKNALPSKSGKCALF